MDATIILLRLVHVLAGTFWVGAVLMTAMFLIRAVADAGPAGGQVMAAMIKRRYMDFLPSVALLTLLSGIDLLRRVSGQFDSAWFQTRTGTTLSVGAAAAVVAFLVGALIARPATMRAGALMGEAAALPDGPDKAGRMASAGALRARGTAALQLAAVLLVISTACMAIARYL